MSGGVDSSAAAAVLLREGYDVVGCFMRLGSPGESLDEITPDACGVPTPGRPVRIGHQGCCSITDAADARLVAATLGIPLYVCNFKKDFGRVIEYFVDEYAAGRTPNPCVRCNDWLKFGKLREYATQIGAEFVASGHYARVETRGGEPRLLRGADHSKDQSYVLFGVPREHLGHMLLPVGGMEKPRVRELAREYGLPVFDKPDSQEICFVPDNDYATLVERLRPASSRDGAVLTIDGREVGRHAGQHRFTIGQRRGVAVAMGEPVYVVDRVPATNTVVVGPKSALLTAACTADEANWLVPDDIAPGTPVLAKYRYNTPSVRAKVTPMAGGEGATPSGRSGGFRVEFDEPQVAVAPGQAVVLYASADPDVVLGGGWIAGVVKA